MKEIQKAVILGAGGLAREVLWVFREANRSYPQWEVLGYIDEDTKKHGKVFCDVLVLGGFEWFEDVVKDDVQVICGIGMTETKRSFMKASKKLGLGFCSVVHPGVKMSEYVEIGEGTVIAAGNIITTQVRIGNHVTVNLGCTIGHDCLIGDFCTIAPGVHLSGNVKVGEGADLGTGCVILPGITVGNWSRVGAGAVVVKDVPDSVTVMGVPARIALKERR